MKKTFHIEKEQGQAMVEIAFVLPILLLLILGIMQFGIAYNHYLTLVDAVRAGARTAAVSRQETDPSGAAEARVRSAASDLDQSNLDVTVESDWKLGDDVKVTGEYPYEIDLLGIVVKRGNLTSTTTERVE
jgi:Flp pilus assembly protein TadG